MAVARLPLLQGLFITPTTVVADSNSIRLSCGGYTSHPLGDPLGRKFVCPLITDTNGRPAASPCLVGKLACQKQKLSDTKRFHIRYRCSNNLSGYNPVGSVTDRAGLCLSTDYPQPNTHNADSIDSPAGNNLGHRIKESILGARLLAVFYRPVFCDGHGRGGAVGIHTVVEIPAQSGKTGNPAGIDSSDTLLRNFAGPASFKAER